MSLRHTQYLFYCSIQMVGGGMPMQPGMGGVGCMGVGGMTQQQMYAIQQQQLMGAGMQQNQQAMYNMQQVGQAQHVIHY